jgi:hypothetical protein
MKTNTLMPRGIRGVLVAGAAVTIFASLVMFAYADTSPSVTATAYNSGNTAITSSPIGGSVLLTAAVASSSTSTLPTGTVTFNRYANTSCSGSATIESGVALVNGVATSSAASMTAGGLSYIAHYSGDTFNVAADSACKAVAAMGNSVTVTASLSTTTAVFAGSSITEGATLSGATSNAGGSVAYSVFSNNSCTALWGSAGSKTVMNALVANSDPFVFNIPGTYYLHAVYSGDSNNSAATSSCLSLSVLATSSNPTPAGPGSISGRVYNDQNHNDKLDAGETGLSGFTVNLYKGAGWWGKKGNNDVFKTMVTDANGNYTFTNLADGTYSVELIEQKKNGWLQSTSDFKSLTIKNGSVLADKNFGNTAISTSTNHGGQGDKGDTHDKGGNGNHFGWKNFWDRFGSFPWGHNK